MSLHSRPSLPACQRSQGKHMDLLTTIQLQWGKSCSITPAADRRGSHWWLTCYIQAFTVVSRAPEGVHLQNGWCSPVSAGLMNIERFCHTQFYSQARAEHRVPFNVMRYMGNECKARMVDGRWVRGSSSGLFISSDENVSLSFLRLSHFFLCFNPLKPVLPHL